MKSGSPTLWQLQNPDWSPEPLEVATSSKNHHEALLLLNLRQGNGAELSFDSEASNPSSKKALVLVLWWPSAMAMRICKKMLPLSTCATLEVYNDERIRVESYICNFVRLDMGSG